jgi:hypothetical protein
MNLVKEYDDVSKGLESWATPTSILTTAISDKYNLQIKEITPEDHTHEFYYQLMIRNGFIFNFKYDQRCFHSKILHHGTSLGLYFLPAINYCRDHFWCDDTEYYWPKHVIDYNIDHCICFDEMLKAFIARLRKYNFDMSKLKIYTISLHTEETINTLVKDFKAKVYSLYGMTSTCGPVLWQITSPENVDNFNPRAFKEIDQFYQIDISNEKLTIKYGNKCVHTNDRFDKRDDVYYFLG